MNTKKQASAVIAKISKAYDKCPESNFAFGVLSQAILDLADDNIYKRRIKAGEHKGRAITFQKDDFITACEYLNREEIMHAELIGIDSSYVQRILNLANLNTTPTIKKPVMI